MISHERLVEVQCELRTPDAEPCGTEDQCKVQGLVVTYILRTGQDYGVSVQISVHGKHCRIFVHAIVCCELQVLPEEGIGYQIRRLGK